MVQKNGSQPQFEINYLGEVMIPMRDNIRIAAEIYVPKFEGRFPALIAYAAWCKELASDLQWDYPPQPSPSFLWAGNIEAGNSEYLVSRGYCHIIAQFRGSGNSEGAYDFLSGFTGKPTDVYDLIEWVSKQPWCDGNVGMIGISAYAMTQLLAASQHPPALKAIFPYDMAGDMYRDMLYHGGMLALFATKIGDLLIINEMDDKVIRNLRKVARRLRKNFLSGKLDFLIDYTLNDFKIYTSLYRILIHPQKSPFVFTILNSPFDGSFHKNISSYPYYDEITIPIYCGSGWYGGYSHLPGAFRNYLGINNSKVKKFILGPDAPGPGDRWFSLERPWHQYHDEIIRWYDYWLKGIDTGILDEPSIKLFVMGANRWRYENEWPLKRTKWEKYYLHSFKRLMKVLPKSSESLPDAFIQQPLNTTNEIAKLEYFTEPLPQDLEITGPIALYLYASINSENKNWIDTNWIVALCDVMQNGEERELTRGYLKASHRALDLEKSKPWQPYHPHTKEKLEKIENDKIYEFAIEIIPTSNVFKEGHRIKLEIRSAELPYIIFDIPQHVSRNDIVAHKIYRSKEYSSYLLLPIIPYTENSQWLDEERARHLPTVSDGTSSKRTPPNIF